MKLTALFFTCTLVLLAIVVSGRPTENEFGSVQRTDFNNYFVESKHRSRRDKHKIPQRNRRDWPWEWIGKQACKQLYCRCTYSPGYAASNCCSVNYVWDCRGMK